MTNAAERHFEGYTKENIDWRRGKVMEYLSHGFTNQSEIARIMQVPLSTINKDTLFLKQQAKDHAKNYSESFEFEFEKCLAEMERAFGSN